MDDASPTAAASSLTGSAHAEHPVVVIPGDRELFRVARSDRPLAESKISVEDAAQRRAGNRFDVLGGGVLYLGSTALGCYLETLARLRPTAAMRTLLAEEDPEFMVCGSVPRDWRTRRLQLTVTVPGSLPFLDVEDPRTHEYLTAAMAPPLAALGVPQLDVSDVRGRDRIVTRAIASWAYAARDVDGPLYSGIRYLSRHGEHECWAVFDGTPLTETARTTIELTTPGFAAAIDTFGLRAF